MSTNLLRRKRERVRERENKTRKVFLVAADMASPAPASTSTSANRSIRALLLAQANPRFAQCPVCGAQVALRDINRHLDQDPLCRPNPAVPQEVQDEDDRGGQEEEEAKEDPPPDEEDPFEDSDTDFEAVQVQVASPSSSRHTADSTSLKRSSSFTSCVPRHLSSSSPPLLRASRSISRSPNRFNPAVRDLQRSGGVRMSPSPARSTRGSRFSPLPRGGRGRKSGTPNREEAAKRNLFQVPIWR